MTLFDALLDLDGNGRPIYGASLLAKKTMTFDGGTTNDPGDFDGTGNPADIFTVTGDVLAHVFATCGTLLEGATATLEVGVTGGTALLLAQTTATDIDANEAWVDSSPGFVQPQPALQIIAGGADIIQTVATANITAGVLTYYCLWRPLSTTGLIVPA